ncbi:DUF6911 family protein [Pseudomonas aeruginosa]|uniref:DUF6911 family protein n=1 Tax=Pseudomonas aeruginosa TaxID=287 RepID=UPI0013CE35EA|nr:hypothetical protein [Pseudomonas aeruginosa]MBG4273101.1 hypothetical protein [Pseudomonas aeruginosa]QYE78420.1 hypothetical protein KZ795_05960 [Pseudomonas aeruginosa]
MVLDYEDDLEPVLELCRGDNSASSLAVVVEQPVWESIEKGIVNSFKFGGFVRVEVIRPKKSFVRQLSMKSLPGRFRINILTRSTNPKEEYLEWWELDESPYRGMIKFGDDDFDSRTVCTDISIAEAIFKELYETGDLDVGLSQMRSPWNPKP